MYFFSFFSSHFFFSLSFLLVKKSNKGQRLLTMSITWIYLFNPLSVNGELSRHENLTFFWTWILRWVPRSFATHASLCNTLSFNKCPKTVKILALKGLMAPVRILVEGSVFLTNLVFVSYSIIHSNRIKSNYKETSMVSKLIYTFLH